MRSITTPILAFALAAPAVAQVTSPPGYDTTEGLTYQNIATTNGYSYFLGRYADMRMQTIDREIKANGVTPMTRIGFRPDYRSHSASTGMGRTFNCQITLSDGDHDTMTTNFANNQLSTPTAVFSGSVTWPTLSGNPSSVPAPWDAAYAFPFGTGGTTGLYLYSANTDLCIDYTFSGGTLANAGPWSGTTGSSYYLDGVYTRVSTTYGRNVFRFIGATTGDCRDSAISSGYASASIQVGLYGPAYTANPAYTGKAVAQVFGSRTAPNSTVLHALGVAGTTPGIQIPSWGCYNLMIDTTQLAALITDTTNATGGRTWRYIPMGDLSVLAPLGTSLSIWSQGAWTDSSTGQTMLTAADRCTPNFALPMNPVLPKMKTTYRYDTTTPTGFGPYNTFAFNPIIRYN